MKNKIFLTGLLLLATSLSARAAVTGSCDEVKDPIQKSLCLGLHPANTPFVATPYSPFVRMIRTNGSNPLDVHACVKMDVIAGAGKLKLANGKFSDANPYPYIGFEMEFGEDPHNAYNEYIEAGVGYVAPTAEHAAYFGPYLRRAPDQLDVAGEHPPVGFKNATRDGKTLPGYWLALDQPSEMMAPDGELCFTFSFNSKTNFYTFDFDVSKTLAGAAFHANLNMASARMLHHDHPESSRIQSFASRLLTSVAISHDDFHPADPAYGGLVFGAHWRAMARDQGSLNPQWTPFDSAHFEFLNSDPTGRIIFYRLDPLS